MQDAFELMQLFGDAKDERRKTKREEHHTKRTPRKYSNARLYALGTRRAQTRWIQFEHLATEEKGTTENTMCRAALGHRVLKTNISIFMDEARETEGPTANGKGTQELLLKRKGF